MAEIWNWINQNSAGVQAVGSVVAILIAVGIAWWSHWLDVRRAAKAQRRDEARALESVASIVIHAMNLIEKAKELLCGNRVEEYCMTVYDVDAFKNAEEALREIPVAQLPNFEVVRPVLEMRKMIPEAMKIIEKIRHDYVSENDDLQETVNQFRRLHRRANMHTSTVESVVNRARDND